MRWLLPTVAVAAGRAPTCPAAHTSALGRLGDGVCDAALNNEGCGFDLGDCCASTSIKRGPFESCADPAEAVFDASCGESHAKFIGDGRCDQPLNTEACIYDGGDCCRWSCARRDCVGSKPS